MPFDFHAKNAFLTYPQCDLSKEEAQRQLSDLFGPRLVFGCVAHEFHQDGGDHLHAFLSFDRKFRTRDERFFDLLGPGDRRFHPNVQRPRDIADAYDYTTKDGDYSEWGNKPVRLVPGAAALGKRDAAFAALDAQHETVDDFMHALRTSHPYEFFTRGHTIRANVEAVKRRRWEYEPQYEGFSIPGAVQDWLDTEFDQEVSGWLCPPSGVMLFRGRAPRPLHAALVWMSIRLLINL